MRLSLVCISGFVFAALGTKSVQAQIDPSSALLLRDSQTSPSHSRAVDSGRYTVRPKSEPARAETAGRREEARSASGTSLDTAVTVVPVKSSVKQGVAGVPEVPQVPQVKEVTEVTQSGAVNNSTVGGKADNPPQAEDASTRETSATTPAPDARTPSVSDTKTSPGLSSLLDLSVAPAYVYSDSQSDYAFRDYHTSGPAVIADANIWFNPDFAVHLDYLSTLSGSVNDSFSESKSVSASQTWLRAGIRTRKTFSGVHAPQLILSLDYFDYQFKVPANAATLSRLSSSGVTLGVHAEMPVSDRRSILLSFSLSPKLQIEEEATGIDAESGGSVDASQVSLGMGRRYRFDHSRSIYWKISHTIEKSLYSGSATLIDPVTSQTPDGVSVVNSMTLFQVGYTWSR